MRTLMVILMLRLCCGLLLHTSGGGIFMTETFRLLWFFSCLLVFIASLINTYEAKEGFFNCC